MAKRKAEDKPREAFEVPEETRLDDFNDAPSTVVPGEAPYDTKDPLERATTVLPDIGAAVRAGHRTVNVAIPLPEPEQVRESEEEDRYERYEVQHPSGRYVVVERNMETGESRALGWAEDHRQGAPRENAEDESARA